MQEYQFNANEYKKKISYKSSNKNFFVYVFICIILMGAVFFLKPKQKTNSDFLYFVEINNFLNYNDATALSTEIQEKAGAGYIYYDGTYHVFAHVYLNKADAQNVCNNLAEEYPTCKVFSKEFNKNINLKELNDSQKKAVKILIEVCDDCLNQIYENILNYDKGEIDNQKLILNFKNVKNYFENCQNEFNSSFANNSKYNKAKTYLEELKMAINNLSNENSNCNKKYELIKFSINYLNVLSCF